MSTQVPPAPLYRDPIYDGAADPTLIWNVQERTWWMVYSVRRATVDVAYFSYMHGTSLGIASSPDGCRWTYRGTLEGLEFARGHNTFWAPEILRHEDTYHMYVSYVPGVPCDWEGTRAMMHYTSPNLWDWTLIGQIPLASERVIDACVHRVPGGAWRMWYKDEVHSQHTYAADSDDLYHWHDRGPAITDCAHEGPNVFFWQGSFWMVTDPWAGLGVYRSPDAEHWVRQANILDTPGQRSDDGTIGRHADVLVQGDEAYIFYFTHPQINEDIPEPAPGVTPYQKRRSSIQVAKLSLEGERLCCDRDAPTTLALLPGD